MKQIHKPPDNKLREYYVIRFEVALLISLLITTGAFKINWSNEKDDQPLKISSIDLSDFESIFITRHSMPIPPPPPAVIVPLKLPKDQIIEEPVEDIDMELALGNPLSLPNTISVDNQLDPKQNPLRFAEVMPELQGGISLLQKRIKYPRKAIRDNVEGRIIIQFVVNEQGKVVNPVVLKGIREDCDNEALKAISQSRFIPGRQQGVPVPVVYTMFIMFKIEYS